MVVQHQRGGQSTVLKETQDIYVPVYQNRVIVRRLADNKVLSVEVPQITVIVKPRNFNVITPSPVVIQSTAIAQGPPGGSDWSTANSTVTLNRTSGILSSVDHGVKGLLTINRDGEGRILTTVDEKNNITRQFNRDVNGVLESISIV